MKILYTYQTRKGLAAIGYNPTTHRFHAIFAGEQLEHYHSAMQAADDLAGGHAGAPSSGLDTSTLGIPDGLNDWTRAA
jgi:hypothetical protein